MLIVRAKAGEVYAFRCDNMTTVKKHLRADGYMWKNKRTQYLPDDMMLKTYFYARLLFHFYYHLNPYIFQRINNSELMRVSLTTLSNTNTC